MSGMAESLGPYDLIHSHYWLSGDAAMAAARAWQLPLVASLHTLAEVKNLALAEGEVPEPLARVAGERRTIHAADRVLVPTQTDAHHLIDLYSADPARIRIVAPGVDARRFRPRDRTEARRRLGLGDGPVVLFVGRLQRLKGPDVAIEAFSQALSRAPGPMRDARLVLVGGPSGAESGSIRPWLEGMVASLDLADRVTFVPPRPHDELSWFYSAADVLLMPSRSESFGIAALEAQACGTPVVAAEVGGLSQAVRDGGGGFLIAERDSGAYAEAIVRIVSSPQLARSLARSGLSHAASFSWERTVEGLLEAYGELVPALESAQAS
jgi:D-inositol-3-phosphate glycosyltransferase